MDRADTLFHWYQQNAVTIIQTLLHDLKHTVEKRKGTVNVLVATKQLESFAFEYAMVHLAENQSDTFSEENYGTYTFLYVNLCRSNFNVGYFVVLLIVKTEQRGNVCFDGREPRRTTLEAGHVTNNRCRSYKPH